MASPQTDGFDAQCQQCGTRVSSRFRKVFGANDATIYGCIDCMTLSELCDGKAAVPEQAASPRVE